ncbi:MAG TPA: hypothetical protein VFZ49_05960 [Pyrinomonadaceae bacterium]
MKRFIVSALCVSLAFIGAGAVVDKIIAGYKSDDKALEIIAKARTAIGGDAAIGGVRSFVIKGTTNKTVSVNGVERIEQGETEIVFESPNRLMKMVKMGDPNAAGGDAHVEKKVDVVVVGGPGDGPHKVIVEGKDGEFITDDGKKIIIRKSEDVESTGDGETKVFVRKKSDGGEWTPKDGDVKEIATADGKKFTVVSKGDGGATWTSEDGSKMRLHEKIAGHKAPHNNELVRTLLSLLVTAPEGMDVGYTYAGETTLDGIAAESVLASFAGSSFKLFFDRASSLPLGMSYVGHGPVVIKMRKADGDGAKAEKDVVTFNRKIGGPEAGVENVVRFADYRSVNGLLLPYRWTTTAGGKQTETFDVTSYEINPANISEKFKGGNVMIRMKKPDSK